MEQRAELWAYCLAFYGKPGRAPMLIEQQQRHGLWINQYLSLAFAQAQGLQLARPAPNILAWHQQLVKPCRYLRISHARGSSAYQACLALELKYEQAELMLWAEHLLPGPPLATSALTTEALSLWPRLERSPALAQLLSWLAD